MEPSDVSARNFADECRRMLENDHVSRLGSLDRVLVLSVSLNDLRTLPLDPQAAFVVSRVDGVSSIEMLLDVCAMPRLDALAALVRLVEEGVLRVE